MRDSFAKNLSNLIGKSVRVFRDNIPREFGEAPSNLAFSDGTELRMSFWRLIKDRKAFFSSFDHEQKYGLPTPIDAIADLQKELDGVSCTAAHIENETGDLAFHFDGSRRLQVFNFTGYEIWEIKFPDGTGQYSNYALLD